MAFEIIIKPLAKIDLEEAILWYENELSGLGNRFYQAFIKSLGPQSANILMLSWKYRQIYVG
jgi:hypothetical protein